MPAPSRLVRAAALVAALAVLGGCLANAPVTDTATPSPTATPASSPTSATPADGSAQSGSSPAPRASPSCPDGVSFWGLAGPSTADLWAPDVVRVGYTLPANASVFFVASEGDAALGHTRAENEAGEYPVAADGDGVRLDRPLSGTHTVRVVAVADRYRDGEFDPAVDPPCEHDGDVVQAGPRAIDFGAFEPRETSDGSEKQQG